MGKQRSATVLLGLGLAAAFVWQIAFRAPDEYLRVFVMNVPDGPALYLVAPGGQQVLLNGSSSSNQLSDQLGRQQPLNKRRLDAVFLLSENSKYLKGLPRTLDRFPVDLLVRDPALLREDDARLLEEAQFRDGLRVLDLQTGEIFWLDTDISLKVILHYQGNAAVVLNWKNFQLLMPNGIPPDMLQRYAQSDLRSVDVLILTDADSQSQDDWIILDSVLITTPLPCMVEENAQWISYEEIDWINLRTDGEWMWLETDRLISE